MKPNPWKPDRRFRQGACIRVSGLQCLGFRSAVGGKQVRGRPYAEPPMSPGRGRWTNPSSHPSIHPRMHGNMSSYLHTHIQGLMHALHT